MLSRIVTWLIIIMIAGWVISNPSSAGDTVHGWITSIFTFMHHVS